MRTVADLLRWKGTEVVVVRESLGVVGCARKMADMHVGSLLVEDETGAMVGIVTRHDLVAVLTSAPEVLMVTCAGDVMSTPLRTVASTTTLDNVSAVMHAGGIRHMAVVHDGLLIGVLSVLDLLETNAQELKQLDQRLDADLSGA